eukprot:6183414-Pyramimonas_sp.AAC.2
MLARFVTKVATLAQFVTVLAYFTKRNPKTSYNVIVLGRCVGTTDDRPRIVVMKQTKGSRHASGAIRNTRKRSKTRSLHHNSLAAQQPPSAALSSLRNR